MVLALGLARVTNRPAQSLRNEGTVHPFIDAQGLIYVPYGPDFTATDSSASYGLQGGVKAHEWEFRITDLLKADSSVLKLQSFTSGNVKLDVILGQVEVRLKAPPPPPRRQAPPPRPESYRFTRRVSGRGTWLASRPWAMAGSCLPPPSAPFTVDSRFSTPDGKWGDRSQPVSSATRARWNPVAAICWYATRSGTSRPRTCP